MNGNGNKKRTLQLYVTVSGEWSKTTTTRTTTGNTAPHTSHHNNTLGHISVSLPPPAVKAQDVQLTICHQKRWKCRTWFHPPSSSFPQSDSPS